MRRATKLKFKWRRSRKAMLITAVGGTLSLLLLGGGVYAAFGGTFRPQSSNDIELQRGLVGWYKLDSNTNDSSPYRHNGTPAGTVSAGQDRGGAGTGAMNFDGSISSYIDTGYNFPLQNFTVSIWAKADGTGPSSFSTLISNTRDCCSTYSGFQLDYNHSSNNVSARLWAGGTGAAKILISTIDINTWDQFALSYDGTTFKLYKNGSLVSSAAYSGTIPVPAYDVFIGKMGAVPSGYSFGGSLDDARIYNRAVSANEVKALYDQYDARVNAASGEKGLVGWWKLDGNANDSSPYRDNGTVTGATLTSDRKNAASSAYNLNGTSAYITLPAAPALRPATAMTLEAWVSPGNINSTSEQKIFSTTESGGYTLLVTGSGTDICAVNQVGFVVRVASSYVGACTAKFALANGTWSHVAGVYDGSTVQLYINGSPVASTAATGSIGYTYTDVPLCIGVEATRSACGAQYFNGTVDDVRLYNRALSAAELQAQYNSYNSQINLNANPTNTTSSGNINQGLVGYWNFNGNAKDSTPYRDNGTVNGATLTTDRFNQANSAYAFIGSSGQSISLPAVGPYRSVGTNSFTVAAWVNTTDSSGQRCVMSTAGGALGFRFGFAGGRPYYLVGDGTHYQEGSIGTATLNDGQWHHLVIVYDHNTTWNLTSYIDGTSTGTVSLPSTITGNVNGTGSFIGSMGGGTNGAVTGSIDAVRFYNRALTLTEVQALYNSGY